MVRHLKGKKLMTVKVQRRNDTRPNEAETFDVYLNGKFVRMIVVQQQQAQHDDGRLGLLLSLQRPRGAVWHEVFEPYTFENPHEPIYLGEAAAQGDLARKHSQACDSCGGSGRDKLQRLCRNCDGHGRIARKVEAAPRPVKVLNW